MKQIVFGIALLLAFAGIASAQQRIKIMVPENDSCAALVTSIESGDVVTMMSLGNWALGFMSGVAQAKVDDLLRDMTSQGVMDMIYENCQRQPNQPLSLVVEQVARMLVTRLQH